MLANIDCTREDDGFDDLGDARAMQAEMNVGNVGVVISRNKVWLD